MAAAALVGAARRVAVACIEVLYDSGEVSAIHAIARQLARGWAPLQLIRAAIGYAEMFGDEERMNCAQFFGHHFDLFCVDCDFRGASGTYVKARRHVAWYPEASVSSGESL